MALLQEHEVRERAAKINELMEEDAFAGFSFDGDSHESEDNDDTMSSVSMACSATSSKSAAASPTLAPGLVFCLVCSETLAVGSKSRFCMRHRRAYESIERSALKQVRIDAETKQPIETEQSEAFKKIFGYKKKGHPTYEVNKSLAGQVVLDFLKEFPEGKEKAGNKKRIPSPDAIPACERYQKF
jgi:hypothetical protein